MRRRSDEEGEGGIDQGNEARYSHYHNLYANIGGFGCNHGCSIHSFLPWNPQNVVGRQSCNKLGFSKEIFASKKSAQYVCPLNVTQLVSSISQ